MNILTIIFTISLLAAPPHPPQPLQPAGYVRPQAYLPSIVGQDYGQRIEAIPVARPSIWVHVKFVEQDAHAKAQALIFNPNNPGGLWTILTPIEPGWFHIHYRLEWNEIPEWLPDPPVWEQVMQTAPPAPSRDEPTWWHEQRVFRVIGEGFVIDAVFVD